MSLTQISYILVISGLLVAALVQLAYALTSQRRATKRPVYGISGVVLLYLVFVYLLDSSALNESLHNPVLVRVGFFAVAVLIIANTIVDWRRT